MTATRDRREHEGCPYLGTEEPMPDGRILVFCNKCGLLTVVDENGSKGQE